jgi:hypothetical protein
MKYICMCIAREMEGEIEERKRCVFLFLELPFNCYYFAYSKEKNALVTPGRNKIMVLRKEVTVLAILAKRKDATRS